MSMSRRNFLPAALGLCALPRLLALASAETYPARPIKLVIPYPPGGVNDEVGRPWADKLTERFGTVVVENVGGAGGSLGASAVARAAPDGYTILLGNTGTQVIHPLASKRPPYHPLDSFAPIAVLGLTAVGIVVAPSVPAQTLGEFIAYAKKNAASLAYASPGSGSLSHLTSELFKSLIGTPDIVHVPYRGVGPAMSDLMSGRVALMTPNITAQILALHRSSKVRLLAVTSPARITAAPEIPTAVEAGLTNMVSQNFIGLFAPPKTPEAIVRRVSEISNNAVVELRQTYVSMGFEPATGSNPESARRFVEAQIAQWSPVIKTLHIELD